MAEAQKNLLKGVTVSRMTLPNDANVYGNVHGGTTLKLIEEAGIILSTKFCNYAQLNNGVSPRLTTTLARIESVDFMRPMRIGEVVELTAEIIYTSHMSILVEVTVDAEDIIMALKQTTNRARLWYVAWDEQEGMAPVPSMLFHDPEQQEAVSKKYSSVISGDPTLPSNTLSSLYNSTTPSNNKASLGKLGETSVTPTPYQSTEDFPSTHGALAIGGEVAKEREVSKNCACPINTDHKEHTPGYSETCLSMMIGINDVAFGGNMCKGGVFLKLMDECAGIVAAKHCRTNVVTACMDATNFYSKIRRGHLLTIHGRSTFTSAKSMEVEVWVEVESPFCDGGKKSFKSADAFFTYVSIASDVKPRDVPQLVITSEEEKRRFEAGHNRYLKRKENRLKMK